MAARHFSFARWQTTVTIAITLAFTLLFVQNTSAQTYTVLHSFSGGSDGAMPYGGLAWDGASSFYGTATQGGYTGTRCYNLFFSYANGCGTVFRLHRSGSSWTFSTLYEFRGGMVDGNWPQASLTVGRDGSLYGTTRGGDYQGQRGCENVNTFFGCGIVFNLRPPTAACKTALCSWTETIIYAFPGTNDGGGSGPGLGQLVFDQAGNLYGTNWNALGNTGEIYQLIPSGDSWTLGKTWVNNDTRSSTTPGFIDSGVVVDAAGNVYGTSKLGPNVGPYCTGGLYFNGCGTVYQLTPTSTGYNWNIIYPFTDGDDGEFPISGLVADQAGNLYGTTSKGGAGGGGVVFQQSPSGGTWTYNLIYSLPAGNPQSLCYFVPGEGCSGPWGNLLLGNAGDFYGATYSAGTYQYGNVFKLTHSNGNWTYTDLYDFTGGNDGANPIGSLILDGGGNIFGTTSQGGASGDGVVFEITP